MLSGTKSSYSEKQNNWALSLGEGCDSRNLDGMKSRRRSLAGVNLIRLLGSVRRSGPRLGRRIYLTPTRLDALLGEPVRINFVKTQNWKGN